jgi:O-methyltransferase
MQRSDDGRCRSLYLDLLKRSLANTIYGDTNISPGAATSEYSAELRENGRDWPAMAHTMIGMKRLNNLQDCVERILIENIPGDLIETGVWRGGASILMRGILEAFGDRNRQVWVADSFEGLPEPDPIAYPADTDDGHHDYAELAVSLEQVEDNFRRYGLLDDRVRFVKGWFRDTLPTLPAKTYAVLRLDGDMYESTIVALESLYPKLSSGGFVIIDDYGAIEGCRLAVQDFRDAQCISAPIHEVDWTGVYWMKTPTANVDAVVNAPFSGTIDALDFLDARGTHSSERVSIPRGLKGSVRGWSVDTTHDQTADRVFLRVDSSLPIRTTYGLERPDVATSLGSTNFTNSGFTGTFPTSDLEPGTHTLCATAVASDGTWLPLAVSSTTFIVEDSLDDYARQARVTSNAHVVIDEVSIDGAPVGDDHHRLGGTAANITVRGWAADESAQASAAYIFAICDSRIISGTCGIERADVAVALESDELRYCGFTLEIPRSALAIGDNTITIRALLLDGRCFEAPQGVKVQVDGI